MIILDPIIKDILSQFKEPVIKYIMLAVAIDVALGIIKAIENHALNSETSINGLFKQALIIILPPLLHPILVSITGGDIFYGGFIMLLMLTVLLSIVENYAALGLPYPEVLTRFIDSKKTSIDSSLNITNDDKADKADKETSTHDTTKDGDTTNGDGDSK